MSTVVHTAQPMKTCLINRFFFIACVTLSIVVLYYIYLYIVYVYPTSRRVFLVCYYRYKHTTYCIVFIL